MSTNNNKLFGIPVPTDSRKEILEKVYNYIKTPGPMRHVVSLNPEIFVIASEQPEFCDVLASADIRLLDGAGVIWATQKSGKKAGERYTGVDFMTDMVGTMPNGRSRVLLLGGRPGLAEELANCYAQKYPNATFHGLTGINNIKDTQIGREEEQVFAFIRDYKPHIIFAAFGSPFQELWFWRNQEKLAGTVCVGVGGAFDFISGKIPRAPAWIRTLGMEWLFRLILQPWRIKRQLRLLRFVIMALKEKK